MIAKVRHEVRPFRGLRSRSNTNARVISPRPLAIAAAILALRAAPRGVAHGLTTPTPTGILTRQG